MPNKSDDTGSEGSTPLGSNDGPFGREFEENRKKAKPNDPGAQQEIIPDDIMSERETVIARRESMGIPDGQQWHTILDIARSEARDIAHEEAGTAIQATQEASHRRRNTVARLFAFLRIYKNFLKTATIVLSVSLCAIVIAIALNLYLNLKTANSVAQNAEKLDEVGVAVSSLSDLRTVVIGEHACSDPRIVVGSTEQGGTNWRAYPNPQTQTGIQTEVDISRAGFSNPPTIFTSLGGNSNHWGVIGYSAVYQPTSSSFDLYLKWDSSADILEMATRQKWYINWITIGC